jgi:hypothetical protein
MTPTSVFDRVEYDTNGGCWLWAGHINQQGYGRVYIDGKPVTTHRRAFLEVHGEIPAGKGVLHRCDVRACIRPDHLYAGTQDDNVRDMVERGRINRWNGRRASGANPNAKLTQESADAIRASGERNHVLAGRYGVCVKTISNLRNGRGWAQ